MGECHEKACRKVSPCAGRIILFENIVAPGVGTMMAGLFTDDIGPYCHNWWTGFLQLILAPLLIGWIWSIKMGWEIYKKSQTA